jgi:hypothetical protein
MIIPRMEIERVFILQMIKNQKSKTLRSKKISKSPNDVGRRFTTIKKHPLL